jgi:hypothetical protein
MRFPPPHPHEELSVGEPDLLLLKLRDVHGSGRPSSCSSQPRANRRRNDVRGGRDRGQLFRGTGSLVSGHGDQGIYIRGDAGSPIALLTLTDTVITHNRIGIYADFIGQVHLVHSTVTLNSTGVFTLNGGVIYTAGNNSVIGNLVENFVGGANVVFFKSDLTT